MLQLAVETAIEAGKFLRMNVGKVLHIERKQGQETNLVTEIDKKTEALIIRKIKSRYGSHDFLGEESGGNQRASEYKWIIDPLDGTTNFTHGLPIYCVSIGLEFNGEIIAGAVYDPNFDELYSAEKEKGAFLNGRRMRVSTTSKLVESLLVTGFPYDVRKNADRLLPHFNNFLMEAQAVRRLGSAALDLCYVACGRFDGFWEASLNPWDMAAGVLILEEAGGKYTDLRGFPSSVYNKELLVSNGKIHDQMVEVLKRGMN
ncbi:MAG: inositol monophosphatase [Ignavibacteriales bacterium]|nr:inositol monophosphatase [Ignavibacteriales bacterium]